MFQKDDIVVYGAPGVCRIVGIIEKTFAGNTHSYYELRPVYDEKSTVFVPVENQALVEKMHRVLSADAIHALIQEVPKEDSFWISDETARKKHYKEVIESGDRKALMGAIKTLYHQQKECQKNGKKLHVCDERFFKDAERILYDEFAFVLHLDRTEILNHILSQLEENVS